MKKITVHSDGACHGNPGPGGWAAVLQHGAHRREISGGVPAATNNRMELQAAIEALRALKESCEIEFHTDSEYLRDGISAWIHAWKRNRWRTADRKPVKNADLWQQLDALAAEHRVRWHWLKGHAGHAENERCDVLANQEIARLRQQFTPAQLAAALEDFKKRTEDSGQQDLFSLRPVSHS
jgi:ribonuclease HI